MRSVSSVLSGALPSVAARGISLAATLGVTVVAARTMEIYDSGAFFLLLTTTTVFATVGRWGTDNLAMRISGAGRRALQFQWRSLAIVGATVSILVSFLVILISPMLASLLNLDVGVLRLSALGVLPQAMSVVAGAFLRASNRIALGTLAEIGSTPVLTLLGLVLMLVAGVVPDQGTAVFALVVASWMTACWAGLVAWLTIRGVDSNERLSKLMSAHGSDLAFMMSTSLIFFVVTWAPVFILSSLRGPEEVALYATASRLANLVLLLPAIQVSYLAPRFARLHHAKQMSELNALSGRSALFAAAAAVVPCLAMIIFGGPLLALFFGQDFRRAAIPLALLSLASLITVAAGQINPLMLLVGDERAALIINLGALAGWAILGVGTAALWSITGVATYFLLTSVMYSIAGLAILRRRSIHPYAWRRALV